MQAISAVDPLSFLLALYCSDFLFPSSLRLLEEGEVYDLFMNFLCRNVLRVLLENLEDEDGTTRSLVFGVLTEMLKQVRETALPISRVSDPDPHGSALI